MKTSESDGEDDINAGDHFEIPPDSPPASKRAQVEEVEDEGEPPIGPHDDCYVREFPHPASQWIRHADTAFESLLGELRATGKDVWEPFASEEEWELAMWLMKNVGQKSTDEYLNLPI
ncbi:hypothetical protein H0H81_008424, partial [Sphagnurus paluster]